MMYLYFISCLRYTILVGKPHITEPANLPHSWYMYPYLSLTFSLSLSLSLSLSHTHTHTHCTHTRTYTHIRTHPRTQCIIYHYYYYYIIHILSLSLSLSLFENVRSTGFIRSCVNVCSDVLPQHYFPSLHVCKEDQ